MSRDDSAAADGAVMHPGGVATLECARRRRINAVASASSGDARRILAQKVVPNPSHEMTMPFFVARSRRVALVSFALACLIPLSVRAQAPAGGEVLSNTSVVNMISGKVSKELILTKIRIQH